MAQSILIYDLFKYNDFSHILKVIILTAHVFKSQQYVIEMFAVLGV